MNIPISIFITLWMICGTHFFCVLGDGMDQKHIKIWKKILFVFVSGPLVWFCLLFILLVEVIPKLEKIVKNFFYN